MPVNNLVGTKKGHLTILHKVPGSTGSCCKYVCKCDCGKTVELWNTSIYRMKWPSCGCRTLSNVARDNGKFAKNSTHPRKLGPDLINNYYKSDRIGFKRADVQLQAQISRAVTCRLSRNKRDKFNTTRGTKLDQAFGIISGIKVTKLRRLRKQYGNKLPNMILKGLV